MAKKSPKKQKLLTFEQLLIIFRTMISRGWKAKSYQWEGIRLKSPGGREYCYCPVGALVRFNGHRTRSGTPKYREIQSPKLVSVTHTHPQTALSVALAADEDNYLSSNFSPHRRRALLKAFGFSEPQAV